MKIGIDVRLWDESGVGRYIRNLIIELLAIDKSNKYCLFTLSKDSENIKYQISNIKDIDKKLKIIETNIRWHSIEEQYKFLQILNRENLDLVHFPYFSIPIFYNRPFVITIHDVIIHHFPTGQASTLPLPVYSLKLLAYKYVISQAAKHAKKIMVPLEATKKEVIKTLKVNPGKVEVTYEGADDFSSSTNNLKLLTNNLKKLSEEKFFLYVGNAYPHKNLLRMLEAFANVKSQISNVKLILVGKEDYFYRRLNREVQSLNLANSIIFAGEVNDEELGWLYKNAIALVAPSLMEGFGLTVLEAMASGCLVLASDIPSFHEVCKDAAIYFKSQDISDLTNALKLIFLLDKKNKEVRIAQGFKRAKDFSWRVMAEKTLEVYKNAV